MKFKDGERVRVKPLNGLLVPNASRAGSPYLSSEGEYVKMTRYFRDRLADGDIVVINDEKPKAPIQKPLVVKSEEK